MKVKSLAIAAALLSTVSATLAEGENANDSKKWMARLRILGVNPQVGSSIEPIGGKASVSSDVIPELDFSYFFTKNIALELILGTSHHKVRATGTSDGDFNGSKVKLLPPILSLQYHFTQLSQKVKPYLGAGLNYTIFYDAKKGDFTSISYKNKFGYALQAGVDVNIQGSWYFNIDVKKLWLKTTATINESVKANVRLNPWIFGAGVGYRF
ncbi:MAG TPA: OmpW family protein [Alphaproteobacteria bacterium]|nr:OmpW family protein [Alphaproteobacteria bacterium]